jgi:hypothetical protein
MPDAFCPRHSDDVIYYVCATCLPLRPSFVVLANYVRVDRQVYYSLVAYWAYVQAKLLSIS